MTKKRQVQALILQAIGALAVMAVSLETSGSRSVEAGVAIVLAGTCIFWTHMLLVSSLWRGAETE